MLISLFSYNTMYMYSETCVLRPLRSETKFHIRPLFQEHSLHDKLNNTCSEQGNHWSHSWDGLTTQASMYIYNEYRFLSACHMHTLYIFTFHSPSTTRTGYSSMRHSAAISRGRRRPSTTATSISSQYSYYSNHSSGYVK